MKNPIDTYLSIADETSGSYREKASKFISYAVPVASELEVKMKMDRIRKEYHDANHFCYAFRIGFGNFIYRVNDDGEPSGSAGKPIYGQILSKNLTDILIVVVRYFGGKKLGIPGLINAYRTAAMEALVQAQVITKIVSITYTVKFPYIAMNEVMRILKEEDAKISMQASAVECHLIFSIRKSLSDQIRNRLSRINDISIVINI